MSTSDWPRARLYPLLGAALALGAPGGLLCLRAAADGNWPSPAWALKEMAADPLLYIYIEVSTTIVFAVTGGLLGARSDSLRILSSTDPLTNVMNRRGLHLRLAGEMARVERFGTPMALLLVDIDGLKKLNDHLGHRMGDAALCRLAAVIRASIREVDLVARLGGDEFVVLAPGTRADEALALAGRIRTSLQRPGDRPASTVSIGVAEARRGDCLTPGEILSRADEALYAAKSAGRDRAELTIRLPASTEREIRRHPNPEHQV
jgi:diguanylate cyclase (GGDEF)-like protein